MPFAHAIDPSNRTVFGRFWGLMTFEDVHGNWQATQADPAFDPHFQRLVDMRDVTEIAMTANQISQLGEVVLAPEARRRAYVVASKLHYGLVRMFMAYTGLDEGRMKVFYKLDEACAWLGLDPAALPDVIPR